MQFSRFARSLKTQKEGMGFHPLSGMPITTFVNVYPLALKIRITSSVFKTIPYYMMPLLRVKACRAPVPSWAASILAQQPSDI